MQCRHYEQPGIRKQLFPRLRKDHDLSLPAGFNIFLRHGLRRGRATPYYDSLAKLSCSGNNYRKPAMDRALLGSFALGCKDEDPFSCKKLVANHAMLSEGTDHNHISG